MAAPPWLAWLGVLLPVFFAALVYMALRPPSVDLAAQMFRSELFASHGFLSWNNYWYGGHHLPGYSLLFPPLGAAVGATVVGGLAAVGSTALFGTMADRVYGPRARLATLWFGAGTIATLLSGRLTFALGVAVGLAALLALQRGRPGIAAPLAVATSLASPVAGFFLVLIGGALGLAGSRRDGATLAASAAAPIALMSLAFPGAGSEPFAASSLAGTLAVTVAVWLLLPRRERLLRWGIVLYACAVLLIFVVPTPLGGNVVRLSNLLAGPVLALGLAGSRRFLVLALCAVPLLYWQWHGAVRDFSRAAGDPSVEREFYAPLLAELDRRAGGAPVRIEIPPTLDRWEAYYVSPEFMLARGWMRQLESDELKLFRSHLTPATYRAWLRAHGVSYVALPDARLDYIAKREAALVKGGLPYLELIWSSRDWRLYEVRGATGLVDTPLRLTSLGVDWFELRAPQAGLFKLRIHFNAYWTLSGGAVACLRERGPWTLVEVSRPGRLHVGTGLSADGLLGRHRVCSERVG
ncbi:MAG TPA: hypothetical protein VFZ41_11075 [Solirubrobacterales bacterium]